MRVLILAEDCNPKWPSLPVVGYKYAKAIADRVDVTVVTQIRNKENIEKVGLGRADVVYIDTEVIAAPLYKFAVALRGGQEVGWTMQIAINYPSYLFFEWKVWNLFKDDLKQGKFDVIHRITPMTPSIPSPMAEWSPIPFVLGPLNGNLPWPKFYESRKRREKEWLSNVRNAYRVLPYSSATYQKSTCVLAAFDHTISDLPESTKSKTINYPEVGIDPELFNLPEVRPKEQMTILFAGRLVPYKMPEVVVRAFANSPILQNHKLQIIGEGPEREVLEKIIAEHHLENCTELVGKVDQARVGELMKQANIFAFPSIRELGAGVVLEAMACGMACVVVDYGGPATLIGQGRGIKVPMADLGNLVISFQDALEELVVNPLLVEKIALAAHNHALKYYSWPAKAQKTLEVYSWVTEHTEKPNFWE
jgi:glycosyltransferase involved in cell wall biosynthesis